MNTSRVISCDLETFYDKKTYSVVDLGTSRYCRDEQFDAYMISVSDGHQSWAGHPNDFNWSSLEGATLLSHNANFDQTVIREMQRRGLAPEFKFHDWLCTANMTSFLCNRRALAQASEFLLGATMSKDARNDANGKHWRDIVAAGNGESMLNYARQDALTCHQLFSKFGHFWTPFERKLSALTMKQASRGVQIDVLKLEEYYKIVHAALGMMQDSLPWVKEGKKVLSPKAVAEECRKAQIPAPPVKSHEGGEEAFAEWYKTYVGRSDLKWIRTFSDVRSIATLLDTLEKFRMRMDENGILTFGLLYFGSHTGRWAGTGGINFLNFRKAPFFFGDDGLPRAEESECNEIEKCFTETKKYPEWVRHVVDIRSLIIARPGKKLIISDLSQIEPRVLAWMVGDHEMLASMAAGKSPYQAHAENTMQWTRGDMKELVKAGDGEAKKLYALAKARVLGLGFQCAWEKFITMAMTLASYDATADDPEFTQATEKFSDTLIFNEDGTPKMVSGYGFNSKKIVRDFREKNPKIVGLWKTLDDAYKGSVGGDFVMELPSGRKMTYRNVREEWSRVYDEDLKKYRNRRVVKAEIVRKGRVVRDACYGGMLTENAVQATAREIFGEHCLTLDSTSGIEVLFGVHDETVNECDLSVTPRDVEHIMGQTPEWIEGCPVAAEAKEAACYLK